MHKSNILSSNMVLFLDKIADSNELLTYPNKYNVFNLNYENTYIELSCTRAQFFFIQKKSAYFPKGQV